MLGKLAVSGIRSKLKDYIVLLAGLVMSISIFYMFQTLAWNKEFTSENSLINSIQLVFNVGSVLLAVVTFFYILYTNSFLLSLRQKEFGMYMLLGAKKKQIQKIMFIETLVIGAISLVIGIGFGILLAEIVGRLLMNQLNFTSTSYSSFFLPAVAITLVFFIILFLINGLINSIRLSRLQILELVHAESQTDLVPTQGKTRFFSMVVGIIFLGIGYFALINMENLRELGLIAAPTATTIGTYLIFSSLIPSVVNKLKRSKSLNEKGIHAFTFSQLRFRINGLKTMLATVTMLIALGAGAISAGMAFQHNVSTLVELGEIYDVAVFDADEEQENILSTIEFKEEMEYRYKMDEQYVYFEGEELDEQRPLVFDFESGQAIEQSIYRLDEELPQDQRDSDEVGLNGWQWANFLREITEPSAQGNSPVVLSTDEYNEIDAAEKIVFIGRTDAYTQYLPQWKQLNDLQQEQFNTEIYTKYTMYEGMNAISSGTVFMGFFLGIAFLAMMASCLMFKVLSGATKDIGRYQMLRKIGVRPSKLSGSVYKELFFIFLFPGIFGIVHVLVGMNLFSFILLEPYYRIWLPILLFIGIYAVYYLITVNLYKGIVMPKEK
ncbi:ABC transporter permease [Alkalicoccobacillus murimartini]|uniref:ABC transport system permease protein n=1 Tax=Alkalicoccobacillus murimartini TaxID=171685 RepID=A0ABT9YJH3_9BACI|nr:ABC transporter permease [Alkalicoccobacillus murimartini]MDQ0207676.1 putative ABC transport system permease protein [Alkalicoccobacillus murimartini]